MVRKKVSDEYDGIRRTLWAKKCEVCPKTFWVPKHRWEGRKTCSVACDGKRQSRRVVVECRECGEKVEKKASRLKQSKSGVYFCSRACKDLAQRIGGVAAIQPPHYSSGGTANACRRRAFRLFEKKCMRCGYDEDRRMLDVHHRDGNRENNATENLEVLCVWCHALDTRGVDAHVWSGAID